MRRRTTSWPGALLATAALVLAACGDDPVPGSGWLNATVVGPNGPEGAAVVLLPGEEVDAVEGVGGTEAWARADTAGVRIVLVHPTGGDLAFEVAVDDVSLPVAWVVEQVAGPDDVLRADVSGYSVTFAR